MRTHYPQNRSHGTMLEDTSSERIGDFLVKIGALTAAQRDEVIAKQTESPDRLFGQIAIELGYINDAAVDQYLEQKRR